SRPTSTKAACMPGRTRVTRPLYTLPTRPRWRWRSTKISVRRSSSSTAIRVWWGSLSMSILRLMAGGVVAEACLPHPRSPSTGLPSEALTSQALLSQRERREKDRRSVLLCFFLFPSLPPGERGQGSEGFGGQAADKFTDPLEERGPGGERAPPTGSHTAGYPPPG